MIKNMFCLVALILVEISMSNTKYIFKNSIGQKTNATI